MEGEAVPSRRRLFGAINSQGLTLAACKRIHAGRQAGNSIHKPHIEP